MKKLFFIGLFFVISAFVFAQNSFETIVKSDLNQRKTILSMQEYNGKYILAGLSSQRNDTTRGSSAYFLVLQNNGSVVRDTTILMDNAFSNIFLNVHTFNDRLFLLGYSSQRDDKKQRYVWFVEVDTNLHIIQEKRLPVPYGFRWLSMQSIIDSDDNMVLSGTAYREEGPHLYDIEYPAFYKISLAGDSICAKFMTDSVHRNKSIESIIESPDHSMYYAFGSGFVKHAPYEQMLLLDKNFDSIGIRGVPNRVRQFSTPVYVSDSLMVVGGQSSGSYPHYFPANQMTITSFNPQSQNGHIVFPTIDYAHFTLDTNRIDYAAFIEPLSYNGEYLYFGGTFNLDFGNIACSSGPSWFHLLKLDTHLNPIWEKRYSHKDDAYYLAHSTLATSDGGCMMVGKRYDGNPDCIADVYVIKVDANGEVLWTKEIGIQHNINVYPNPGGDRMHIQVPLAVECPYYVELFNTNGALIKQATGYSQTLSIPMHTQSAGLYLYKVYNHKHQLLSTGKWIKR